MIKLYVILEGGIVQGVYSTKCLGDVEVTVIDNDLLRFSDYADEIEDCQENIIAFNTDDPMCIY